MDSLVAGRSSSHTCEDRKPIIISDGILQMQSVIQSAGGHASVMQGPGSSGSLSAGMPKGNVIIFNNKSVIQANSGPHPAQLQVIDTGSSGSGDDFSPDEDPVKKRREILARRPSYRKIFTELPGSELADEKEGSPSSDSQDDSSNTSSSHHQGVALAGAGFGTQFLKVSVSPSDLQSYALQSSTTALGPPMMLSPSGSTGESPGEEATRKREVRLMKNREAARECRRKKKEYIKCLESRVAVLENQNKALIDELKTLKELYCQKAE